MRSVTTVCCFLLWFLLTATAIAIENAGDKQVQISLGGATGSNYVVGDVNGSNSFNGLDVIYGVAYLKGGKPPMCSASLLCRNWHYCGDVNGSCSYNGLDVTYGVAYLKGGPALVPCQDCPPIP